MLSVGLKEKHYNVTRSYDPEQFNVIKIKARRSISDKQN